MALMSNDVEKKARMKEIKRKANERGIGFDVGNSGHACTNVAGMSWLEWEQRSLPYGVGVGEWWEPAGGMARRGL